VNNQTVRYVAVIEACPEGGGYSAYLPDLPGCVAAGETVEQCKTRLRTAVAFHLESLRDHGEPIPPPSAVLAELVAA
jgi:predicted RNase H-like HicB family nuclease